MMLENFLIVFIKPRVDEGMSGTYYNGVRATQTIHILHGAQLHYDYTIPTVQAEIQIIYTNMYNA